MSKLILTHRVRSPQVVGVRKQGTPLCRRRRNACSVNFASVAGSIRQNDPLPGSSCERATFTKYRFRERLCRIEFWNHRNIRLILNPFHPEATADELQPVLPDNFHQVHRVIYLKNNSEELSIISTTGLLATGLSIQDILYKVYIYKYIYIYIYTVVPLFSGHYWFQAIVSLY